MKELITDAYTEKEKAEAWDKASETVMKYSNEMVEHWNKEIDGLLTFVSVSLLGRANVREAHQ